MRITDDCIGVEVDEILITFGDTGFANNRQRVSGNSLDGIYEVIVSVPAGHKIGNFEVLLFPVDDENGNTYVPAGQVNGFISIGYVDEVIKAISLFKDQTIKFIKQYDREIIYKEKQALKNLTFTPTNYLKL